MNLTKRLKVEPDSQVDLASIDPSFRGKWTSAEDAKAELERNLGRISTLQRKLYADRRHCLLIVLQGIDGAGKDGTCWHVISAMVASIGPCCRSPERTHARRGRSTSKLATSSRIISAIFANESFWRC